MEDDLRDLLPDKLAVKTVSELRARELAGSLEEEMKKIAQGAVEALFGEEICQ